MQFAGSSTVSWPHASDTTLGNHPSMRCATVDNSGYWQAVKQEIVIPIQDIVCNISGYEEQALFAGIVLDHLIRPAATKIRWNSVSSTW
ncbi:Uncharacterized protein HZ326_18286 [Fusarium oxysporum f. sp. albedinis]|nr:Uncharacterized protein HZ326_18286 [Fusarium oxysporum f. sp. albedinis]